MLAESRGVVNSLGDKVIGVGIINILWVCIQRNYTRYSIERSIKSARENNRKVITSNWESIIYLVNQTLWLNVIDASPHLIKLDWTKRLWYFHISFTVFYSILFGGQRILLLFSIIQILNNFNEIAANICIKLCTVIQILLIEY